MQIEELRDEIINLSPIEARKILNSQGWSLRIIKKNGELLQHSPLTGSKIMAIEVEGNEVVDVLDVRA